MGVMGFMIKINLNGLGLRGPFRLKRVSFNGDDAGIEAGSLILDARASSFERQASIRVSTPVNVKRNA